LVQELQILLKNNSKPKENNMKINDKYEISPLGNTFDSLLSLLTRTNHSPIFNYSSDSPDYGNVRIRNDEKQVRIEFLVPGWKKNELSLSIDNKRLQLSANPPKEKEQDRLFQSKEIDVQVLLGEQLDTTKTSAKLEDGVLTVTIPVSAKTKGRSVKIS
jgi:HSP20 family molecular chaperone IbpA